MTEVCGFFMSPLTINFVSSKTNTTEFVNVNKIIIYLKYCICIFLLGCGHIEVDYSGIRCTFLRAREYLESNIMIYLYRVT